MVERFGASVDLLFVGVTVLIRVAEVQHRVPGVVLVGVRQPVTVGVRACRIRLLVVDLVCRRSLDHRPRRDCSDLSDDT